MFMVFGLTPIGFQESRRRPLTPQERFPINTKRAHEPHEVRDKDNPGIPKEILSYSLSDGYFMNWFN